MMLFYNDESFCTSECSRILYKASGNLITSVEVADIDDVKFITGNVVFYHIIIKFSYDDLLHDNERKFIIVTRFRELHKLHYELHKIHIQLYLQGAFPVFPSPKILASKSRSTVLARKKASEEFFKFVMNSNVLRKTKIFLEFVEKAKEINLNATQPIEQVQQINVMESDMGSISDRFFFPSLSMESTANCIEDPQKDFTSVTSSLCNSGGDLFYGHESADDHLFRAAKLVAVAQRAELDGEYEIAFHSFKNATSILIKSSELEEDIVKRNAIRRKTAKYLMKAENIYRFHLCYDGSSAEQSIRDTKDLNILAFKCSNQSLENFKIISILPDSCATRRVFLVEDHVTGEQSVMKLIEKGSHVDIFLPIGIPHMVQLKRFFETESFIILLLEHVEHGLLWNFLARYFYENELRWQSSLTCSSGDFGVQNTNLLSYRGRRIVFAVESDVIRSVNIHSDTQTSENPMSCELLCSLGEDCTGDTAGQTCDYFIVSSTEVEEVEEEDPAIMRFSSEAASDKVQNSLSKHLMDVQYFLLNRRSGWSPSLPLPEQLIVHWMAQLVSWFYVMLTEYHISIGDFTPDKILLSFDGNLLISYFGLSDRNARNFNLQEGYACPESFELGWKPDWPSDIWTLGAILFELLSGRTLAVAAQHMLLRDNVISIDDHYCFSLVSQSLLSLMLCPPYNRGDFDTIRSHLFFSSIDWTLYDNPYLKTNKNQNFQTESISTLAVSHLIPSDLLEFPNN